MKYIDKLRNSGLRPTKQRLQICEVLFDTEKTFHFTINELDQKIKKQKSNKISLATIYNCLNQFTKHEILKSVRLSSDKIYFDTNTKGHHHFFCKSTEKLSDIKSSEVEISSLPKIPKGKKLESVEVVVTISD